MDVGTFAAYAQLTIWAVALIGYAGRLLRKKTPVPVWLAWLSSNVAIGFIIAGGLTASVFSIYKITTPAKIPEFDVPQPSPGYSLSYGFQANSCYGIIDGRAFRKFRNSYRVALACVSSDNSQDILDAPYLQVGSLHDLTDGPINLQLHVSPLVLQQLGTLHIFALLLPTGVEINQFATLRQARKIGVLIKYVGGKS